MKLQTNVYMKKLIFAAAIAMALLTACDDELTKASKNIVEDVTVNAEGSPLNSLWEMYDDELGYWTLFDLTTPNALRTVEYDFAKEGSVTQVKNNLKFGATYIREDPSPIQFIKTYTLKDTQKVGAFLLYEDYGYFYYMKDNDHLTLYIWSPEEVSVEEAKKMIAENAGNEEFWTKLGEEEMPFPLVRSDKVHATDLTKNRITGWRPSEYDSYWDIYDCCPFSAGLQSVADGTFYLDFFGLEGSLALSLKISESLWGKEIMLPEPNWASKYGADATFKLTLQGEKMGGENTYRNTLWELTNTCTGSELEESIGVDEDVEFYFNYDTNTRACRFYFRRADGYGRSIDVNDILIEAH